MLMGKPSLGSWVGYGLGTENQDLPPSSCCPTRPAASRAGRRPTAPASCRRAIRARSCGRARPILDLAPPEGMSGAAQRRTLDLIGKLNARHLAEAGRRHRAGRAHPGLRAGLPDADRPPPRPSTCPARTRRPRRSTGWTARTPPSSARDACWPADWSSVASGSSSSTRATSTAGTPTTTSRPTTSRMCAPDRPADRGPA